MSEENDNASGGLERLLRQWGAEEAGSRAPIGRAPREPSPAATTPARRPSPLPWLVAGAVAAAALVAIFILWGRLAVARNDANRQATLAAYLDANVFELQRQIKSQKETISQKEGDMERQMELLARRAGDANTVADSLRLRLASTEGERDKFKGDCVKAAQETAAALKEVGDVGAKVSAAKAEANAALLKLAAAAVELERSRKTQDDLIASVNASRAELDQLKARSTTALNEFQQAYMSAAAPGETGLKAAQTAVRRTQLVERIGKARGEADASQKPLLDKLEVVLTRLAMLDTTTFVSEEMFRSLLHSSGIVRQIDDAMASSTLAAPMRAIYFESRLILSGAERAG